MQNSTAGQSRDGKKGDRFDLRRESMALNKIFEGLAQGVLSHRKAKVYSACL